MGRRQVAGLALGIGLGLLARPASAQISPGELSEPHAKLEGSQNCLKCHDPKQGIAPAKCLECHDVLKKRIDAGEGLHARADYRACAKCHVDHGGKKSELVWWGDKGIGAFDHALTGYTLEGKHAPLKCAACHLPKLGKTFLGLKRDCVPCHVDIHKGQFGPKCASCHGQNAWKPVTGFDHSKTAYPLTGLHVSVACDKCHPALPSASGSKEVARKFKGIPFQTCASCHQDPHAGKLGANCSSCHTTAGWKKTDLKTFDHDRTAYPLRDRHAKVACDKCHAPGKPMRVKHDRCADCHADVHKGQFVRRADEGRCESCHDVKGFTPAGYTLEDHQKSAYPLAGAHLAIPCIACHRPDASRVVRFRFATTRCIDCHKDPHRGELDKYNPKGGCESCHKVDSWRVVTFDHATTRFALAGGHSRVRCSQCHEKLEPGTPRERMHLTGLALTCNGCHKDVHAGQFAAAGATTTTCERCHNAESWTKTSFVHDKDSKYPLKGAHARVACAGCHRPESVNGARVVRYKPLKSDCKDCHGDKSIGALP
jgi:hypothetical protein